MVKKILSRPRLVKGGKRWHIEFYEFDIDSQTEIRHRSDFDLNDIQDLTVREQVAIRIINSLDKFVKLKPVEQTKSATTSVADAVAIARDSKKKLPRVNSFSTYRTVTNSLLAWLSKTGYGKMPIGEFTRKHAREYWDFITDKKLRGRTKNNYLTSLSALWRVMIEDYELLEKNPFDRIRTARVETKKRRIFTDEERKVVAAWAEKNDYWMFRGILLQYFCYIRPIELCRLKFRHFNFAAGTVTITEEDGKNYRERVVTIPRSILHYFCDGKFDKYHTNLYMYGMPDNRGRGGGLQPAPKPADRYRMAKRHVAVLRKLQKRGQLQNIDGLCWYSWKDTGITRHLSAGENFLMPTKDQAGHTDIKTTMIYRHEDRVNLLYRDLPNDLF